MEQNALFGERLRALIYSAGISMDKISEATGISVPAIHNYSGGRAFPRIEALVRIADFFAVPLDYLMGRCDLETANAIQADYSKHYMALRREPYEMYLTGRDWVAGIPAGCEAPWPYNLLDDIGSLSISSEVKWEDRWQDVLSTDQEAGLMAALESLTDRELGCVLAYYRDGLNLEGVGKIYGVTRERIRQIIKRGIRRLRHPSRFNQIRFGLEGAKQGSEYTQRTRELAQKKQELDSLEEELRTREKVLTDRTEALGAAAVGIGASAPLENMDLSVRSFNVLLRAGCKTVGDVEALAQAGKLPYLRNMGRKSAELAQAALKLRRVLDGSNPTPVTEEKAVENLLEEYGDVIICMETIITPDHNDAAMEMRKAKKTRWVKRLREADHGTE